MSNDDPLQPAHLEAFARQLQNAHSVEDAISSVADEFGDDLFDALHDLTMSEMRERSIDRFDSGHMIGHV